MANKKHMTLTVEEIVTIYHPLMEVCEGLREMKENIFTVILTSLLEKLHEELGSINLENFDGKQEVSLELSVIDLITIIALYDSTKDSDEVVTTESGEQVWEIIISKVCDILGVSVEDIGEILADDLIDLHETKLVH